MFHVRDSSFGSSEVQEGKEHGVGLVVPLLLCPVVSVLWEILGF